MTSDICLQLFHRAQSTQPLAMSQFKLSAVLKGHTSDVRAVLHPHPSFAVTASRDGSIKLWKQSSQSPPTFEVDELSSGNQFKTCLSYLSPTTEFSDGLIISAGQDTLIEARQPGTTAEQNADAMMVGHSNQVCSLDADDKGQYVVSGSWDGTAKVWSVGNWEVTQELGQHTATVWSVVVYDRDTIVTGCADKAIRVFTSSGKQLHSFDGHDVVRALTKLDNHSTGAQIASASNDGVIRLWKLDGTLVGELHGHENFIYSLTVLPDGLICSSGEDRSIRIWKDTECIQVITLPAISVWSVAAAPNGDIIAGASDKIARIFTREDDRVAPAEVLKAFEDAVKSSALPKQQVGEVNTTDLPGPEFLTSKSGTKEGQTAIVKDTNGQPTVYQWSMAQQQWQKIGQLVDSAASGDKVMYQGQEYDFVFDVDIEDGKPPLKLPFNATQNPYDAATKFLQDNELPMSYLEETANFVIKNSQAAQLGQQAEPSGGADPWGQENRYRPGEQQQTFASPQPRETAARSTLPQKDYLSIVLGKPSAAMGQITKLNNSSNSPLSPAELDALQKLAERLDKQNFQQPSLATAEAEPAVSPLLKIISQWEPLKTRLAALDLLRFLAAATPDFPMSQADNLPALFKLSLFSTATLQENNKLAMVGYRAFANLMYASSMGRDICLVYADDILDHLVAGAQYISTSTDSNFAIALTTLALNTSVLITTDLKAQQLEQQSAKLTEVLSHLLTTFPAVDHSGGNGLAQTTEPAYRALIAFGTILSRLRGQQISDNIKKIARSAGADKAIESLRPRKYLEEPRFKRVVAEVNRLLK